MLGTDYEQNFGVNHWRVVLYKTLADDAGFCDGGFKVLESI